MELKQKFRNGLKALREGAVSVVRRHPVELVLLLALTVTMLVYLEREDTPASWVTLLGWSALVQLIVNLLVGQGPWRRIYWVVWLLFVPLALWPGLPEWLTTPRGLVTLLVLTPLALLACRRARENRQFVSDVAVYLRSAVLAMLLAYVAYGLFEAILWSTVVIFGFSSDSDAWVARLSLWLEILNQFFVVPVLFMMMLDRWLHRDVSGGRILEVMLNYIFTPAVVAYAAILYLYLLKILFTWRLPDGGVAYLVFGFTMTVLLVKALRQQLARRIGDWFYDRLSLLSLPIVALFWVGVARRVGEYGLTDSRIYLLVCGSVMTVCILLFLSRRTGRYLWVVLASMAAFASVAYIPALSPRQAALRSQSRRVERIAAGLGRLEESGRLSLAPATLADTLYKKEYRELYEALEYVERDSAAFARFGLETSDDLAEILPKEMYDYVRWGAAVDVAVEESPFIWVYLPQNICIGEFDSYSRCYVNLTEWSPEIYTFKNDTLRFYLGEEHPVLEIPGAELLKTQLERSGFDPSRGVEPTGEEALRLLDYRDERCRILFERLMIERLDSADRLSVEAVHSLWLR